MVIPEPVIAAAALFGSGLAGFVGGRKGSQGALNGTAAGVVRIEENQHDMVHKLDTHIERTGDALLTLTGRISAIEGKCIAVQMAKQWRAPE